MKIILEPGDVVISAHRTVTVTRLLPTGIEGNLPDGSFIYLPIELVEVPHTAGPNFTWGITQDEFEEQEQVRLRKERTARIRAVYKESFKILKYSVRTSGAYNCNFAFETLEAVKSWVENEFPLLEAEYPGTKFSVYNLPGFETGATCGVYGEGLESFEIIGVKKYGEHQFGYVLEEGWAEEVSKCYDPQMFADDNDDRLKSFYSTAISL